MKLKFSFLLFILFSFSQIFSQENADKNLFGIELVGFYPLADIVDDEQGLVETEQIYLAGINGLRTQNISAKADLIFNIGYRYLSYNAKDYSLTFGSDHDGNGGVDYYKSWADLKENFHLASAAAFLKYKTHKSPVHFYLKPGVEIWVPIGSSSNSSISESALGALELDGNVRKINAFSLSVALALGYEFKLGRDTFFAEARGMYMPSKLFKEESQSSFFKNNVRITPIGLALGTYF